MEIICVILAMALLAVTIYLLYYRHNFKHKAERFHKRVSIYERCRKDIFLYFPNRPQKFYFSNGQPLAFEENGYELHLRDIHPVSIIPSRGFMLQFDAANYPVVFDLNEPEKETNLNVWFRPANDVALGFFVVNADNGGDIELESEKFGILHLPKDSFNTDRPSRVPKVGNPVLVTQYSSWCLQLGYRIYFKAVTV